MYVAYKGYFTQIRSVLPNADDLNWALIETHPQIYTNVETSLPV